ncbi:MAG: hypothetical protein GY866_30475 [Proteobacteria bacterium]|nr:hypothetical protein [Pseudomonadota bacterium]
MEAPQSTPQETTVQPVPAAIESPEETEEQKQDGKEREAEERSDELRRERLEEIQYRQIDDNKYSFVYDGDEFMFKLPDIFETAKIKSMLSQIAPDALGQRAVSATDLISRTNDLDVLCTSKAVTHLRVLLREAPEGFVPDVYFFGNDEKLFDFGYCILISERRTFEDKKKA